MRGIFWERRGDQRPVRDGVSPVGNRAGLMAAPAPGKPVWFQLRAELAGKIPSRNDWLGLEWSRRGKISNDSLAAALEQAGGKVIPNRSSPNGWTNGEDEPGTKPRWELNPNGPIHQGSLSNGLFGRLLIFDQFGRAFQFWTVAEPGFYLRPSKGFAVRATVKFGFFSNRVRVNLGQPFRSSNASSQALASQQKATREPMKLGKGENGASRRGGFRSHLTSASKPRRRCTWQKSIFSQDQRRKEVTHDPVALFAGNFSTSFLFWLITRRQKREKPAEF